MRPIRGDAQMGDRDMKRVTGFVATLGALVAVATTAWGLEESPVVPSGMAMTLQELREDVQPGGDIWLRLRYVAPELTAQSYAHVEGDFAVLCQTQAVPHATQQGVNAVQAVISIASDPVEFGASAPEVVQFFEAFRLKDGLCIWEAF